MSLLLFPISLLYDVDLGAILVTASGLYLPLALKRVYGSSTAGAIGKSLFLYFSYGITVVLAGVIYFLVNLATL